eukprot:TRINITY_DN17094_c0_g1_i1.p1 TRINITY_DN17094_c0_g1~~TRINITY_DN17094_c0_g1_i1.p1  ORF type:complete len:482 (+),score=72.96 TRINITY_DN17094_c0_g1_i1:287-1732(+)
MGEAGEDAAPPQALLERLKDYGQEQTLARWQELNDEERELLIRDLEALDLSRVDRILKQSVVSHDPSLLYGEPLPVTGVATIDDRTPEEIQRWWNIGLKAIAEGKLAVVLLSGGQGTRLGSKEPKGCFGIGLPSGRSLFALQAQRILRVQKLAAQLQLSQTERAITIPWYIMTSQFTDAATRKFFENHNYFGLQPEQVVFFQQGSLPCLSKDGRVIMESPFKVARAPDGNGGIYTALKNSKSIETMTKSGVKYVDCYSVDNALVRVADPIFLGYFIEKGVSWASKVVNKAFPQEKVGVFVQRGKGGPTAVMEYSELDSKKQHAINQDTGRLLYKWGNVCLHMFSIEFLNTVIDELERDSIYHCAYKRIPSVDGVVDGIKLEQYIFDAFPYAPSVGLFEVLRDEEFAPVKNASGSPTDSPETARLLLLRTHMRWVVAAGGLVAHTVPIHTTGLEVSPLVSYAGEGLEDICRGRTFQAQSEVA